MLRCLIRSTGWRACFSLDHKIRALSPEMGKIAVEVMGGDSLKAIIKRGDLQLTSADEFFKSA